ncbi:hypothetical protein EON77_03785 [bacterium]|nr:MAG: hypothetical protein EON77_03785 [bacterium]
MASASVEHPEGTALVVALTPAAASTRVTLVEWDPRSHSALRAVQLPGDSRAVRAVLVEGAPVLLRAQADGAVQLVHVDPGWTHARVDVLEGAKSMRVALASRGASLYAAVDAPIDSSTSPDLRVLAIDARARVLAQRDVYGGTVIEEILRPDLLQVHGDTLYVLGHDERGIGKIPSRDAPMQRGALSVLAFDARTLEPTGASELAVEALSPARLSAGERGLLVVGDDAYVGLDWDLHASRARARAHGSYLAESRGAWVGTPASLRGDSTGVRQHECIPAPLERLVLHACTRVTDDGTELTLRTTSRARAPRMR